MQANKNALRQAMEAERSATDAATVRLTGRRAAARLAHFRPYLDVEVILAYRALGNEVPTAEIIGDALRRGKRVFVPQPQGSWFFELPEGDAGSASGERFVPGMAAGLVLVPLVAFGLQGQRLGRGGGWYDRVLPHLSMPTIGVGYDFQQRADIPIEPWDVRLDYVVTESRLLECGRVLSAERLSEEEAV